MNLDRIIAVRTGKTVYRDGERCLKVFNEDYSKADILNEALNQARVEETGLAIPKILEVTMLDGKWTIVSEFIKGKTLAQLMLENPGNKDSEVVSLLPVRDADADTGEKIKEFDRLFSLEERWSGQLEEYYMSFYSRYQEKIKERSGKMSLEQLEEWLKEDIKRNEAMQSVRPGRYLEGEYMKWVMEKQLKAFYAELKSG